MRGIRFGLYTSKQKNMDYKTLIEKYFAGETTLEEERSLKAYFRNEASVEDGLKGYAPLFRFFEDEQARGLPAGFDQQVTTQLTTPARRFRLNPIRIAVAATIAALALLAATLVYLEVTPAPEPAPVAAIDWSKYEPKTPEEAYKLMRATLMKVSSEMNRGVGLAAEKVDVEVQRLNDRED